MRLSKRQIAIAGATGLAALCTGPAAAAPAPLTFSQTIILDPSLNAHQPRVAISSRGNVTIAWSRAGRVFAAAGLAPSRPARHLLWGGRPAAGNQVLLSSAADGRAAVLWTAGDHLHVAEESPSGAFTTHAIASQMRVAQESSAMSPSGQLAVVIQQRISRTVASPVWLVRCGASGRCGGPQLIASAGAQPQIGLDASNRATIAWIAGGRHPRRIAYRLASAGGTLGPVETIAARGTVTGVHLQVSADGSAVLGWGAEALDRVAYAAYRPADAAFSAPIRLFGDLVGFAPLITPPAGGRWWTTSQSGGALQGYRATALTTADATHNINAEPIDTSMLVAGPAGSVLSGWETDNEIQAVAVDPNGADSPLTTVGPTIGLMPSVEASPQGAVGVGMAAVVWLERPRYNPLDVQLANTGRVMLATALFAAP